MAACVPRLTSAAPVRAELWSVLDYLQFSHAPSGGTPHLYRSSQRDTTPRPRLQPGKSEVTVRHLRGGAEVLQRFVLLWLVLSSAAALWWPRLWSELCNHLPAGIAEWCAPDFDPLVVMSTTAGPAPRFDLGITVAVTMFAVGTLLTRTEVEAVVRRWPLVLAGTAIQYVSMPLLAFGLAHAFRLPRDMLVGVVLVGCVPGAMASNVLTLTARGNVSYSVSLTTAATLLSPLVVPIVLSLALHTQLEIDAGAISLKLLKEVVGPVVVGHLLCRYSQRFTQLMQRLGPWLANWRSC